MQTSTSPTIRQGGMGFNISSWPLALSVSKSGEYGTVSGVSLERVLVHQLQDGDPGGHLRRALRHFPFPKIAEEVLNSYFIEGGIRKGDLYRNAPIWSINPSSRLIATTIIANFAFIWLAKESHDNPVGINYLEKVAMPHIYAITGAMLAGVDFVTMGAGIPLQIPEVLNAIVENRSVNYRVLVIGENITGHTMSFDPAAFFGSKLPPLKRPDFIPIIASNGLAAIFTKKLPVGSVQGFVIEEPTAGGHNAPPRKPVFDEFGRPQAIYGEKDLVDYGKIAQLGLPFWIGGSYASPEKLKWAKSVGAQGIQAGSIFALCEQSGMRQDIKRKIRELGFNGTLQIETSPIISPAGFPFKIVCLEGTISEPAVYEARQRVCDQGALTVLYEKPDGSIGYRCPSEPVERFVAKGGDLADTVGRGCLCNGLYATAGLNDREIPIVTLGDDVSFLRKLMTHADGSYTAEDAIRYLRS